LAASFPQSPFPLDWLRRCVKGRNGGVKKIVEDSDLAANAKSVTIASQPLKKVHVPASWIPDQVGND